jgi:hypothetical protein
VIWAAGATMSTGLRVKASVAAQTGVSAGDRS